MKTRTKIILLVGLGLVMACITPTLIALFVYIYSGQIITVADQVFAAIFATLGVVLLTGLACGVSEDAS